MPLEQNMEEIKSFFCIYIVVIVCPNFLLESGQQ